MGRNRRQLTLVLLLFLLHWELLQGHFRFATIKYGSSVEFTFCFFVIGVLYFLFAFPAPSTTPFVRLFYVTERPFLDCVY
jgi:hypothetical protein